MVRRKLLTAIVLVFPPAATVLLYLVCQPYLPAKVPEAWDWPSGWVWTSEPPVEPSAFWPAATFWALTLLVSLTAVVVSRGGPRSRAWITVPVVYTQISTLLWVKTLLISVGAPTANQVDPQGWHLVLVVVVLGAWGTALHAVLPMAPPPPAATPASPLSFAPGQRVLWMGRATSRRRIAIVLGLAVLAVAVAVGNTVGGLAVLAVAGWLALGCTNRVRITNEGVAISRIVALRPRREQLDRITRAWSYPHAKAYWLDHEDEEIDARSSLTGAGGVLVLEGRDHLPLHVSVDHAGEAADVVNALIARARTR